MDKKAKILSGLKALSKVPIVTFAAEVLAVDEAKATIDCKPLSGGAELLDVRIKSTIDEVETGIIVLPSVGSFVLLGLIGNNEDEALLLKCNEVDYIKIYIRENYLEYGLNGIFIDFEGRKLKIDDIEVVFDDGANGGIAKVPALETEFNTIQNDINQLKQIFSAWVTVPQDGGASLKALAASWAAATLTATQAANIENEIIKH